MNALDPFAQIAGQRLGAGRYIIGDRMDEGGMGAVFRAVDTERGDAAAVKVLFPDLARETRHVARFFREAEATMALQHPHIVEVRSVCGPEESLAWFAMELLEGASLHQRQDRGQTFSPSEVVRIGRQMLSALGAAHAIGLLHRDLKPGNVMLLDSGVSPLAKLVDFGIAVFTRSETYTRLTATGMVLGTPAYMPPEQVCGDPLDERSDVYSLAATLHTILIGEPPFGRGSWADILPRILTGARVSLDKRGVEKELARVIERGLCTEPEARWQNAREMEAALAVLDRGGVRTILEWERPARISTLRLAPFEDTGRGVAPTVASGLAGAFPSTREQPSSEPPPMPEAAPVPSMPALDPVPDIVATPHHVTEEVVLPTRGRPRVIAAVALAGLLGLGILGIWALGPSDSRPPSPSVEPSATGPEALQADEAGGPPPSPVLPVGVDSPDWAAEEESSEEVAEEDPPPERRATRRRQVASRRNAPSAPSHQEWIPPSDPRQQEREGRTEPVSDPEPTAAAPAGPPPIRVNVRRPTDMAAPELRPWGTPEVEETDGTHGPMVRFRTHPR